MVHSGNEASIWRRILVTLAVLVVYRLGSVIPLPGLEAASLFQELSSVSVNALTRLSIFAFGLAPYFFVLICAETVKLLFPGVLRWEAESVINRDRLSLSIKVIALALTAVQAWSIAIALEAVGGLVPAPGGVFRAGIVATEVGATALLIWLCDQITRHGVGHGVWLIWATPTLAGLMLHADQTLALARSGEISQAGFAAGAIWLVGVIVFVTFLAKARFGHSLLRSGTAALSVTESLIRKPMAFEIAPLIIATMLCDMLAAVTWGMPVPGHGSSLGTVAYFALLAGLIVSFTFLRGRADLALARQRNEVPDGRALLRQACITAAALIVISIVGKTLFPLLPLAPALLVVILVAEDIVESIAARKPTRP
jgi:preprotein translocase subunit SecY